MEFNIFATFFTLIDLVLIYCVTFTLGAATHTDLCTLS